ncbi:sodium:solute symporter family protein [Paraburkholderia sp. SIMBA_054]|uniref:sodium:solute symporter family protein n=1 Tax=Paraburkholderia sp. SIMBA_054 TaxID=3085795 RepID=UPI0039782076
MINISLITIGATAALALYLGVRARKGRKMGLQQWAVGQRGFGSFLVFLLMAGEIYTTVAFLGGSGFAYGRGSAVYYILAYPCLAYVVSYWLVPPIWRYAKQRNLITQASFFAEKYDSPALGMLVSLVGLAALVPYLVLQFKGLGIIVSTASNGSVSPELAIWIGGILVAAYVSISGVHGAAWTAVLKDITILIVIVFLGVYLPLHYYGSFSAMFAAIESVKPGFLAFQQKGISLVWFDSTIILAGLGFYMWPHTFASLYTARDQRVFRKNAIILPLYQLVLVMVAFVGFAAILKVPGLQGSSVDLSLFRLSIATFDPWVIGLIGAAGMLTALVPGAMITMAVATTVANNIYRVVHKDADDLRTASLAKFLVPLVTLIAVYFALNASNTIVALQLTGYSLITQLFPSLLLSLLRNNPITKVVAFAGTAVGVATVAIFGLGFLHLQQVIPGLPQAAYDVNVGFVGLVLNAAVLAIAVVAKRVSERQGLAAECSPE